MNFSVKGQHVPGLILLDEFIKSWQKVKYLKLSSNIDYFSLHLAVSSFNIDENNEHIPACSHSSLSVLEIVI